VIGLSILNYLVFSRRNNQALKIKSPLLLTVFLSADILSIILLTIVYVSAEVSVPGVESLFSKIAKIAGYFLVCFAEPMLIVSYTLRFLRIKRIFDAQQKYFETGLRPSEMIKKYSEKRLTIIAVSVISVVALIYMAIGIVSWALNAADYGILPSYALSLSTTGTEDEANHMYVSLIFFVVTTLIEGLIFAYFLDQIRGIKSEFSMLPELQLFSAAWLFTTDLTLFIII